MENNFFVFYLNAKPLFNIEKGFLNLFYSTLKNISQKYNIILCTDLNYNNSTKLAKEIGLKNGYIITSCGSSIYDICQDKSVHSTYIKKGNVLSLLRQVIVNSDSIVLHTQKKILIFSSSVETSELTKAANDKIEVTSTSDYEVAKKFIKKNNVEYVEIFNTNMNTERYKVNDENIYEITRNESICYNRLSNNRIIITNSSFQDAIDFLIKKQRVIPRVFFMSLTEIFNNQKINCDFSFDINCNLDNLFKDRTFYLFESSLKESLKNLEK